jgi:hypothetical protein
MNPKDLKKLGDLFGHDLAGWQIGLCYFLELKHTLMGNFPAVLTQEPDKIILTLDPAALRLIWSQLPRRAAKVTKFSAIAHPVSGVAFNVEHPDRDLAKPLKTFSIEEVKALCAKRDAIRWANGLFDLSSEHVFDPVFP